MRFYGPNRSVSIGAGRVKPAARRSVGQAMVEFAFMSAVTFFILLGAIQVALPGQVALALSQATYQGARYAAVNPSADQIAANSYVKNTLSRPTLMSNSGNDLSITPGPAGTPRAFGSSATGTLIYTTTSKLFLKGFSIPKWHLALLTLPSSLSATETALSE